MKRVAMAMSGNFMVNSEELMSDSKCVITHVQVAFYEIKCVTTQNTGRNL